MCRGDVRREHERRCAPTERARRARPPSARAPVAAYSLFFAPPRQSLNLIKYWKGQHIISVSRQVIEQHLELTRSKPRLCKKELLRWQPRRRVPQRST